MSEYLDRVFPFSEKMDPYAEKLYMQSGNGIAGGLTALTIYYRQLARPDLTSEEAYNKATEAINNPQTVAVDGLYASALEHNESPRLRRRQSFIGRVASTITQFLEPSDCQYR